MSFVRDSSIGVTSSGSLSYVFHMGPEVDKGWMTYEGSLISDGCAGPHDQPPTGNGRPHWSVSVQSRTNCGLSQNEGVVTARWRPITNRISVPDPLSQRPTWWLHGPVGQSSLVFSHEVLTLDPDNLPIAQSVVEDLFAMSHTVALTKATFLAYILPPFVCQYLMGVLVQLEGTHTYRLALLPITLCLAWRATFVDVSGGDPARTQSNSMLVVSSHYTIPAYAY